MDHVFPEVHLGGIRFDLAAIITIVITSIIVFVLARLAVRNASVTNPTKMQNFLEWVIEFVINLIGTSMDLKKGRPYLTLGIALIMYIFVANMLGLPLGIVTEAHHGATFLGMDLVLPDGKDEAHISWWKSPTADVAVAGALMAIVILLTHIEGLRRNRKHYLKHYFEPYIPFFPLNVIKEVSKPLSLSLRLYGNIFAGEVMISVIMGLGWVGIVPLVIWQGFSMFIGAIQAFVFVMLTMVYMSQAIIHEDH
ncbi:ATP synthase subunit a [Paenibacillus baekrokdamisoli]|uniref:ATP synthase subunit a n=1 Tax=Paenibacillus baekrokdamisoli TaxID=1712516 RepID=A0A3G9IZ52_9BACL|nr:F0F1 ATP synthase subunit A [Paenibacillus baekrokdamisoli]MBB3069026.1 F-type H+-transporting ATPase subunit a [Paenibacillus baekrokdamisoli]BBH23846.1 ATP synthase subunit a [Paenibacillus baekrokdamisoli]